MFKIFLNSDSASIKNFPKIRITEYLKFLCVEKIRKESIDTIVTREQLKHPPTKQRKDRPLASNPFPGPRFTPFVLGSRVVKEMLYSSPRMTKIQPFLELPSTLSEVKKRARVKGDGAGRRRGRRHSGSYRSMKILFRYASHSIPTSCRPFQGRLKETRPRE